MRPTPPRPMWSKPSPPGSPKSAGSPPPVRASPTAAVGQTPCRYGRHSPPPSCPATNSGSLVAPTPPTPATTRTARFTIPEGLRVYGGFAGTETAFHPTTNDNRPRNTDGTFTHGDHPVRRPGRQ